MLRRSAAVRVLVHLLTGPTTVMLIEAATGLTPEAIRQALHTLEQLGYARRHSRTGSGLKQVVWCHNVIKIRTSV